MPAAQVSRTDDLDLLLAVMPRSIRSEPLTVDVALIGPPIPDGILSTAPVTVAVAETAPVRMNRFATEPTTVAVAETLPAILRLTTI